MPIATATATATRVSNCFSAAFLSIKLLSIFTPVTGRLVRLDRPGKPGAKSSTVSLFHHANFVHSLNHFVRRFHHGAFDNLNGQTVPRQLVLPQHIGNQVRQVTLAEKLNGDILDDWQVNRTREQPIVMACHAARGIISGLFCQYSSRCTFTKSGNTVLKKQFLYI